MKLLLHLLIIFNLSIFAQEKDEHDEENLSISSDIQAEIGFTFTTLKQMTLNNQIKAYGEVIPATKGFSTIGTLLSGRVEKITKGDKLFEISSLDVMELMDAYFSRKAELKREEKIILV